MKLYNAILLLDVLNDFLKSKEWSKYLDKPEDIDFVFSIHSDLSNVVSKAMGTPVSKTETLGEAMVLRDTLYNKVDVMKHLVMKEVMGGNISIAEDICGEILSIEMDVKNLEMIITKVVLATEV